MTSGFSLLAMTLSFSPHWLRNLFPPSPVIWLEGVVSTHAVRRPGNGAMRLEPDGRYGERAE
jgi:hypothetical protein